jgi:IS5 family transposase
MRQVQANQLQLSEIEIANIKFDSRSRDDIPQLLKGLQYLYVNEAIRAEVFQILESLVPKNMNAKNGRPGMLLWNILVMGVLRLNLSWDYDRLLEMLNHHQTIREMLGHHFYNDDVEPYKLQTLKDNVSLLTTDVIDQINQVVVKSGHKALKKREKTLKGRCDSFVVETDVLFLTYINLLWDAIRKVVTLTASLCQKEGLTHWRQSEFNLRQIKRRYRKVQKIKHATSKDENKREVQQVAVIKAHKIYLLRAEKLIVKAKLTLPECSESNELVMLKKNQIKDVIVHAERQIDQINRRVIQGKKIPHEEKVFSLFEGHTQWISKGKAGIPVELGLRVCILEDQNGFILNHRVMEKETDDKIAVIMVVDAQMSFPDLKSCSFDKGFHFRTNQVDLKAHPELVVLPKKGRLNKEDKAQEYSDDFQVERRQHSAVESGINALDVHGLDTCPDYGIEGFKRYVALAVLARNIQKLGIALRKQEKNEEQCRQRRKCVA